MSRNQCERCGGKLIEIDRYGERFVGCIECNRWSLLGSNDFLMKLLEDELEDLKRVKKKKPRR
jgi:hypothetical protein